MSAHSDLLAALAAERHNGMWWKTRPDVQADNEWRRGVVWDDDEITQARRRRELAEAFASVDEETG